MENLFPSTMKATKIMLNDSNTEMALKSYNKNITRWTNHNNKYNQNKSLKSQ